MVKKFEELTICDSFIFGKVMEDPVLCRNFLSTLFQRDVGELTHTEREKEFRVTADGKPIRLDIYTRDSNDGIYDVEMQNLPEKRTVESLELPKRSRFYQATIDYDMLSKGYSYKKLKESTIVFICTFDPFGEGRYLYTFKRTCLENNELILGDETEIRLYNANAFGDDIPEGIKKLYSYLNGGQAEDELTRDIDKSVDDVKRNKQLRSEYMKELALLMDAREEGREEERANTLREKERADMAVKRADKSEEEIRRLKERIKELETQGELLAN